MLLFFALVYCWLLKLTEALFCCNYLSTTRLIPEARYNLECRKVIKGYTWCFVCQSEECIIYGEKYAKWTADGLTSTSSDTFKLGCNTYNFGSFGPSQIKGLICVCKSGDHCNDKDWLRDTDTSDDRLKDQQNVQWNRTLAIIIGSTSLIIILAFICICWHQHGFCCCDV